MLRRPSHREPTMFHRVYLAVLVSMALCGLAAAWLFSYLFADGVEMFLRRPPLLILPVAMALLGLGGIVALRAAAPMALPLARLARLLAKRAPREALRALRPGTEETAELLAALDARAADPGLLLLRVDSHLNILDANEPARAMLRRADGSPAASLLECAGPENEACETLRRACATRTAPPEDLRIALLIEGLPRTALLRTMFLPGGSLLVLQVHDPPMATHG